MKLLETIKCNNGILENLSYHQARFDIARIKNFPSAPKVRLKEAINIPEYAKEGLFKCRVVYSEKIEIIEFISHQIKNISSLMIVENNSIDYQLKNTNRQTLTKLYEKRGNCDDILIIKNKYITDSYTANVIFFDGNKWWTSNTPLLCGTQRARLIDDRKIHVCKITINDLFKYEKAGLINAMQNIEEMPIIPIEKIFKSQ